MNMFVYEFWSRTSKALGQTCCFADALVLAVEAVIGTDPEKATHIPRQLKNLQDAAKGNAIPPKVNAAMNSIIPGLAALVAFTTFLVVPLVVTGVLAASGPVGIAVVCIGALLGTALVTYLSYKANAARAQDETNQRNTRMAWADKLSDKLSNVGNYASRLFPPKEQPQVVEALVPVYLTTNNNKPN